jgi:hypothetical protein
MKKESRIVNRLLTPLQTQSVHGGGYLMGDIQTPYCQYSMTDLGSPPRFEQVCPQPPPKPKSELDVGGL